MPEGPYEKLWNTLSESAHRWLRLLQDLANNSHPSWVEGHSLGVNSPDFQPSLCVDTVQLGGQIRPSDLEEIIPR